MTSSTFSRTLVAVVATATLIGAYVYASRPVSESPLLTQLNGSPTGGSYTLAVPSDAGTVWTTSMGGGAAVHVINDGSAKAYCMPFVNADGGATQSTAVPIESTNDRYWLMQNSELYIGCGGVTTATTVLVRKLR